MGGCALLLALAGCGGHPPAAAPSATATSGPVGFAHEPPAHIIAAAQRATRTTRAVYVVGRIHDTVGTSGFDVHVDLLVDGDGDCQGTIDGVGAAQVLFVGDRGYFRPSRAFWTKQADAVDKADPDRLSHEVDALVDFVGKGYLPVPRDDQRELRGICSIDRLLGFGIDTTSAPYAVTPGTSGGKQATVRLTRTDEGTDFDVVYVAVAGTHDVVRVERSEAGRREVLDLERRDHPGDPRAPDADHVVTDLTSVLAEGACSIFVGCVPVVATAELETQVGDEVEQAGHAITDVHCPDRLPGRVGSTTECTAQLDSASARFRLTVTSVVGTTVNFDIRIE